MLDSFELNFRDLQVKLCVVRMAIHVLHCFAFFISVPRMTHLTGGLVRALVILNSSLAGTPLMELGG